MEDLVTTDIGSGGQDPGSYPVTHEGLHYRGVLERRRTIGCSRPRTCIGSVHTQHSMAAKLVTPYMYVTLPYLGR